MGYLYAILSSVFFTLYIIPKKLCNQKTHIYVLFMGIGDLIISIIMWFSAYFFGMKENFFNPWLLLSCLSGVFWFTASIFFLEGVNRIGLSRASQYKNLQGPIGAILILFLMSEADTVNLYLIFAAILFVFLGAAAFTISEDKTKKINITGILMAIMSAVFFGVNAFFKKLMIGSDYVYGQQFWQALFIVISALTYIIIKDKNLNHLKNTTKKENYIALMAGSSYYLATFFMLMSYKYILGSVAYTVSQLYALWVIIICIFIFKEINFKKHKIRIITGVIFVILGIIVLLLSQP